MSVSIIEEKKDEPIECPILCCEINDKNPMIYCPYCNFFCCKKCLLKHITDTRRSSCLNEYKICGKEFDDSFLLKMFGRKFVEETNRIYREEAIYARYASYLPTVLVHIEEERERKQRETEQKERFEHILRGQEELVRQLSIQARDASYELRRLRRIKAQGIIAEEFDRKENKENKENKDNKDNKDNEENGVDRRKFVRPCPIQDCRGFLSTRWICGLCEAKICPDCHCEKKDDDHKCDPTILENIKAIEKDSKYCPKCGVIIFRPSGCDCMFCIQCGTFFDWKSLKILKGGHNPEYFKWLESHSGTTYRRVGDLPCGGFPNNIFIHHPVLRTMYAGLGALNDDVLRHAFLLEGVDRNDEICKRYLLKEIDKDEFMRQLFIRERRRHRETEYWRTLQLGVEFAVRILVENLDRTVEERNNIEKVLMLEEKCIVELLQLKNTVINDTIERLQEHGKYSGLHKLDDNFRFDFTKHFEKEQKQICSNAIEYTPLGFCKVCRKQGLVSRAYRKGYCETHLIEKNKELGLINENKEKGLKCQTLLKTGKRKGKPCGKFAVNKDGTKCAIHNRI
jgi:hypothetical protein